jgi:hypothetical protein
MKLGDAIEEYIEYKRSDGVLYRNQGTGLRSFGRYLGDIELNQVGLPDLLYQRDC